MSRPLRVLSWAGAWGDALREGVSAPFREATGITVEPIRHVGLRLPDALTAALESGSEPPVDVVWCNTSPGLRAAARGWCESLAGDPVMGQLSHRARMASLDGWPIAPTYVVHYVLSYLTTRYPAPPESWSVLEHPDRAGHIVMYPGGNGFYPIAQVMGGGRVTDIPRDMSACWTAVRRLRGRLAPSSYSVTMNDAIRRGEVHLCYRALPNVLAFAAAGLPIDWAAPREGIADTTDAMWVPRGLPAHVRDCARRYVWFALSTEIQALWCRLLGALPLNREVRARSAVFDRGRLPIDPDDLDGVLYVSEHIKATHEPAWETAFESVTAAHVG